MRTNQKTRKNKTSVCEICGKSFFPLYNSTGKYCSYKCSAGSRKRKPKNCLECGESFSARYNKAEKYCSRNCLIKSKRENRECLECSKTFEVCRNQKVKKVYCSVDCFNKNRRNKPVKYTTKTCLVCGTNFERRYLNGTDSTCSRKCSIKRANQIESERRRLPDNKCRECGIMFHPLNREQSFCSQNCANILKSKTKGENHPLWKPKVKMNCEICGKEREVKPSLVSRFRACSRRCAAIISQIQMPRVSSIERKMQTLFQESNLNFQPQFTIGQYIVDFAFKNQKLVVECDGDYWHGSDQQKAKDRRKDGFLKKNGWQILRLTETEIKENPENCLSKVLSKLQN